MSRRYLVTGGAGHLGGTVVRALCERGCRVRTLALPCDPAAALLPREAEVVYGNVTDRESMQPFFSGGDGDDVVIHAEGIVSIKSVRDPMVRAVNVGGCANVISLCREHGVAKLVYVSSVHAIPEPAGAGVISETSEFSPDAVRGLYAKTKAEATAMMLTAAKERLDVSVVHPSGICGPGDNGNGHITQLVIDCCRGALTAGVNGGYDFVDFRDVADGVIACAEKGAHGECYILANRYITVRELLDCVHEVSGCRRIARFLPMWFAKMTSPFAELYYAIRRPPLYTPYSLYTLTSNANFSHEKASRVLGFAPRELINTIDDTVRWLA